MASNRLLLVLFLLSSSYFASSPVSARKIPLALYYETLCPYCSNFIVNYLAKIFENGLIDIVDLDLVPYGNAKVGSNGTISCQVLLLPICFQLFYFRILFAFEY
ncbi:hypothetical protein COCNU_contig69039296G000010 [Cocos nucifera]|nr:hypothetical protein [Cocos nucifera]